MVAQLVVGVPLAYMMAFKAGRFELPMVLGLVVLDGLNPVVRIYAWRMLLGRNGIINGSLEWLGVIDKPIDALLFNNAAVIVVLSTSWITYTVIPIYASMKAIDSNLFQAAADLGAGWWTILRRILLAPGRARDLRRRAAGLHPALHRLRDADDGGWHQRLHARAGGQRPDPGAG